MIRILLTIFLSLATVYGLHSCYSTETEEYLNVDKGNDLFYAARTHEHWQTSCHDEYIRYSEERNTPVEERIELGHIDKVVISGTYACATEVPLRIAPRFAFAFVEGVLINKATQIPYELIKRSTFPTFEGNRCSDRVEAMLEICPALTRQRLSIGKSPKPKPSPTN